MRSDSIDAEPKLVASEIYRTVERSIPTRLQVQSLSRQLLARHSICRLEPVVSSEEIVEGYYRCVITDALVNRYTLSQSAVPRCVNSSHRAVRRVCLLPGQHTHSAVEDGQWHKGWAKIQELNREVNVRVVGRPSAKHADLYVVAGGLVVSLEFKYVGPGGLRDIPGCAAQMRRYAKAHAAAILVLYSGNSRPVADEEVKRLVSRIGAGNVQVANLAGPAFDAVRVVA